MKTCPICQKVLTDQAKFCYFCGATLLNAEADAIVSPEEPATVDAPEPTAYEPVPEPETFESVPEEPLPAEPAFEEPVPAEPAFEEPEPAEPAEDEPEPEEKEPVTEEHASEPRVKKSQYREDDPHAPAPSAPVDTAVLSTYSRSLMTTAGYIFTTLLFHIPVIGLIFMIVWGCGKTKNISLKRFSLAILIMRLIFYIIILAGAVFLLICFSGVIRSLYDAVVPILFP